jgi:hypothetical protein
MVLQTRLSSNRVQNGSDGYEYLLTRYRKDRAIKKRSDFEVYLDLRSTKKIKKYTEAHRIKNLYKKIRVKCLNFEKFDE